MPHIVVDDEQAKLISEATQSVEILDPRGRCIGWVTPGFTEEEIAIAKEHLASDEPRYTTAQVLEHLRAMEKLEQEVTEEEIAIAKQRLASDEPYYTTEEVLEHLRALEK